MSGRAKGWSGCGSTAQGALRCCCPLSPQGALSVEPASCTLCTQSSQCCASWRTQLGKHKGSAWEFSHTENWRAVFIPWKDWFRDELSIYQSSYNDIQNLVCRKSPVLGDSSQLYRKHFNHWIHRLAVLAQSRAQSLRLLINAAIDFIRSTVCIRSNAKEFTSCQADKEFSMTEWLSLLENVAHRY